MLRRILPKNWKPVLRQECAKAMKVDSGHIEALTSTMEPRRAIRTGITASAIAHLSVLMLVFLFTEVHRFGAVTAEPIAVGIVTSEEVAEKKPELAPEVQPSDAFDLSAKLPASSSPAPAAASQEAVAPPPKQVEPQKAEPSQPRPAGQIAAAQPPPPPSPGYVPAEPDLSTKYQVLLGLPQDMSPDPPPAGSGARTGDPFDDPASKPADIAPNLVAEFRRHLKACLKLPPSISPSDGLKIKLRVLMTPEGKLAREPALIEATASAKGPVLMRGAIDALQACQPYAMLPADRYGEWKVLDLSFTPQDF